MTQETITQILLGNLETTLTKIKDTEHEDERIKLGEELIDIIIGADSRYQSFTNKLRLKGLISQKEDITMVHNYGTVLVYLLMHTQSFTKKRLVYDGYISEAQDYLEQIRRMRLPVLFGKLKEVANRNNIDYNLLLEDFSKVLQEN